MTQDERRQYLIEYLLKEEIRFRGQKIPKDKKGQENLLRSLMNVRVPKPVSEEFVRIQDEYLIERNKERGITDVADLKSVTSDSRLYIWQGDITSVPNLTHSHPSGTSNGISSSIHFTVPS